MNTHLLFLAVGCFLVGCLVGWVLMFTLDAVSSLRRKLRALRAVLACAGRWADAENTLRDLDEIKKLLTNDEWNAICDKSDETEEDLLDAVAELDETGVNFR